MKKLKLSREVKTGLITIVTVVAFVWGFNYLKGKDFLSSQRKFYVVYTNVSGLMKANAVTINGLSIGQVDDIYFQPDNPDRIIVELSISNDISIPANSLARIYSADLLGSKGIDIILGNGTQYLQPGDTLDSNITMSLQEEVNQMVQPVLRKAGDMMSSIDTVISALGDVFNNKTRENLIRSIESLRITIKNIEKTSGSIDTLMNSEKKRLARIFSNVESISYNLRQNNDNLTKIISNASLISDTLAKSNLSQTIANLEKSMHNLASATDKINNGEGSVGLLLNDDELYNGLESSSKQLELLIKDIRLNPNRYVHFSVFGRSTKKNAPVTEPDSI